MAKNGAAAAAATSTLSWEELLGSNNWSGHLDPLHPDLRTHLLRCGSFCQIAADSIIYDGQSKNVGQCRYSSASILRQVFFKETADYVVPNTDGYLYTTIGIQTNWMGYVAVSSDHLYQETKRREIYVVWRGTNRPLEVLDELKTDPVKFGDEVGVKIMEGWNDIYTHKNPFLIPINIPSAQVHLHAVIKHYLTMYKDQNPSIICVGHSLGGTLAILSAFDIASSVLPTMNEFKGKDIHLCAVAFDAPKVGNKEFNDAMAKLKNTKVLRINNRLDIVTNWPPRSEYVITGTILLINSEDSAFLKSKEDYGCDQFGKMSQRHALPVILHTLTGWSKGFDNNSQDVIKKLPLVNRTAGHLKLKLNLPNKPDYTVIEGWWTEKNHGMAYDEKEDKWYEKPVPWE